MYSFLYRVKNNHNFRLILIVDQENEVRDDDVHAEMIHLQEEMIQLQAEQVIQRQEMITNQKEFIYHLRGRRSNLQGTTVTQDSIREGKLSSFFCVCAAVNP